MGTPTEGSFVLNLPLQQPTLHVGISFVNKDIQDRSALHFHFTTGSEITVNLLDFADVENGVSFSCSVVYCYTGPGQGVALLNVSLLSNPDPSSFLNVIPSSPNVVPFIDSFDVICVNIGDSPTSFNWCYSAFA
jgi:hypothetical protein